MGGNPSILDKLHTAREHMCELSSSCRGELSVTHVKPFVSNMHTCSWWKSCKVLWILCDFRMRQLFLIHQVKRTNRLLVLSSPKMKYLFVACLCARNITNFTRPLRRRIAVHCLGWLLSENSCDDSGFRFFFAFRRTLTRNHGLRVDRLAG